MAQGRREPEQEGLAPRATRTGLAGRAKRWFVALLALVLLAWGGHWLYQRLSHVHIDDARIDGEVVTLSDRFWLVWTTATRS
jgi:hypothetical protein